MQVVEQLVQSITDKPGVDEQQTSLKINLFSDAAKRCESMLERNPDDVSIRLLLVDVYGHLGSLLGYSEPARRKSATWF